VPTLNQVRNAIDNWVTNRWATVVARQENYRANKGRYWQGLRTHLVPPAHANNTDGSRVGDNLNANPTDQFESWLAVFPEWLTELLPACVRVDVYDGPSGQGWVLIVEATHNGNLWRRRVNVGPETSHALPWTQVPVRPNGT
jgi:hypothetical protein